MDFDKSVQNGANPYGLTLANNIASRLQGDKVEYANGNIFIYITHSIGEGASLKGFLYTLLKTLPDIAYPLQRIQFIIYVFGSIELVTVINPSEFDIMALDKAIIDALSFSSDAPTGWNEAMPLDHPYYQDKDYFKKNGTLKDYAFKKNKPEAHILSQIKDQPNVKPLLDDLKKDGLIKDN